MENTMKRNRARNLCRLSAGTTLAFSPARKRPNPAFPIPPPVTALRQDNSSVPASSLVPGRP